MSPADTAHVRYLAAVRYLIAHVIGKQNVRDTARYRPNRHGYLFLGVSCFYVRYLAISLNIYIIYSYIFRYRTDIEIPHTGTNNHFKSVGAA